MPEEGMLWMPKENLLTYEEITRLVSIFTGLGVSSIRLTGGEPLMRKDLHLLVRAISSIQGIVDLALTTNGYFLAGQIADLAAAGLRRINVSMDSLNRETFTSMVRRDYFDRVWNGLHTLEHHDISPVKINVVLLRGVNDHEIEDFARLARSGRFVVRFIEFMPIGAGDGWTMENVVPAEEVVRRINALGVELRPVEYHGVQPADRYRFSDGIGEVGFISSVSEPFCSTCNRVRITSDGKLRTCLFAHEETDLRHLLRSAASDDRIRESILEAVYEKKEGHLINRPGFFRPARTMSQIGG
jgi:cyclic pyranopterin phosphate synthase